MSDPLVIRIHPADDVVIARQQLVGGTRLGELGITVAGLVPPGHKIAVRAIAQGAPVRRYNQIIGTAKQPIAAGQHVHTHNLEFSSFARDYAPTTGTHPTQFVDAPATFMGIKRADGRIATRNYIGVLTSVNCSATVARAIADHFRRDIHPEALAKYPNVRIHDFQARTDWITDLDQYRDIYHFSPRISDAMVKDIGAGREVMTSADYVGRIEELRRIALSADLGRIIAQVRARPG